MKKASLVLCLCMGISSAFALPMPDGVNSYIVGSLSNTNNKEYTLFDYHVKAPVNFYSLRMVNADGNYSYSNIVILRLSATDRLLNGRAGLMAFLNEPPRHHLVPGG
jgi:hypothetical protein